MPSFPTKSGASNFAVRVFLSQISIEIGRFNKKTHFKEIITKFNNECAYCGSNNDLEVEHIIGINKHEVGLNIKSNVIPSCHDCNDNKQKKKLDWQRQLELVVTDKSEYHKRYNKILNHLSSKNASIDEHVVGEIKKIAEELYKEVSEAIDKKVKLIKLSLRP